MNENLGAVFGLGCALIWTITVLLFKSVSDKMSPYVFNLIKNTLACFMLVITILLSGDNLLSGLTLVDFGCLFLSGFLGLGLADNLFLSSLKKIGAGWIAVVETAYTPFVFIFSLLILGETINGRESLGVVTIVASLVFVSLHSKKNIADNQADSGEFKKGLYIGFTSLVFVALGVVLTKFGLANVDLIQAVFIRVLGGVIFCLMYTFSSKRLLYNALDEYKRFNPKVSLVGISFVGTYLTLILWVAGFKFEKATVVAVLNQMSTVFTLIASAVILKERLTKVKVFACCLAFLGVVLTIS